MNNKYNPIDSRSVYIAAGLVSGAGALLLNVLPLLFGAFAERFGLGEAQLGNLALAMNLGFGALGLASLLFVHRLSWRAISALSSMLVIGMLLLMLQDLSYNGLLMIMTLAGAGTGALYALAMTIFGDSSQPERAFGFKLGIETVPGAVLLVVLPVAVVPTWGFEGLLLAIAGAMLLMGIAPLPWVPRHSLRHESVAQDGGGLHRSASTVIVWMCLIASLIFLTGIMSVWAFLELIGRKTGLASDTIGAVLALGFIINAAGGFIASSIGLKAGRFVPVAVMILGELLGIIALAQFSSLAAFTVGVVCFLFSISFVLAYTFGVMAEFDVAGKLVALGALCLSLGAAFGPAIGGYLIETFGYTSSFLFSGACSVAALAIYGLAVVRARRFTIRTDGLSAAVLSRA